MSAFQETQAAQDPVHCRAAMGWTWISQAWGLFKLAPGTWIGIILGWFLIQSLLNMIPLVNLAVAILGPVFTGGMLMAARRQEAGEDIVLLDLFAGFKSDRFGPLVLLGLFSILLIFGAVFIVVAVFMLMLGGMHMQMDSLPPAQALVAALLILVLMLPVIMALWFATSLVALHELSPAAAFGLSFRGCLQNIASLSVFSLVLIPLALIAMIPFGLGLLVLGPVMMLAMYRAYVDVFRVPVQQQTANDDADGLG